MYKGPDNSGFVIKLVKEQGILPSTNIHASKSQESTILYCGVKEEAWSSPAIVTYVILSCVAMHKISLKILFVK